MFGIDWGNSQTLWLNLTNLALGVVTLLALGMVAFGVAQEILAKRRKTREFAGMDTEVRHMLRVPELGLTMADGGEPLPSPKSDATAPERKRS
jgi:hypothetical protein